MSKQTEQLNIGITKAFPCSYLAEHKERLIMLVEPQLNAHSFYPSLLAQGFRRSGEQVYRPHCEHCQACQSLRISVEQFKKSRSQKRLINKNKNFRVEVSSSSKDKYFNLYQRYIDQVHCDGPMFPTSIEQYDEFIKSTWNNAVFIEIYDQQKLIAVSVTDQVISKQTRAWSAFYCFYDPDYRSYSLGKFAILNQLKLAKEFAIDWLYLGYYIENCQKMNYKIEFTPHQRFINEQWQSFT